MEAFRTQWRTILKVVGFTLGNGVGFYLCFVYVSTWLKEHHGMSPSFAAHAEQPRNPADDDPHPDCRRISDRIGRKPVLSSAPPASRCPPGRYSS